MGGEEGAGKEMNEDELKLLRELVIKLRREQLERSAAEARARTVNSGALQEAME